MRRAGAYGDLSFAPTGGWGRPRRETVTLSAGRRRRPTCPASRRSSRAENHRDMMPRPITFVLNCPAPCQFRVTLGTIARKPARIRP